LRSRSPSAIDTAPEPFGVVVLAGGTATRFPGKLRAEFGGMPLLARVVANFAGATNELVLSVDAGFDPALAAQLGFPAVVDRSPGNGPLGGMLSAFAEMHARYVFAVAGDAPLVEADFARRLAAARQAGDEAVVPRYLEREVWRIEPLAALYDRIAFLREGVAAFAQEEYALHRVVARLRTRYVSFGSGAPEFTNVNTPEDYERLRESERAPATEKRARPTRERSFAAFERAQRVIPGGVNSTVRAFKGVGGTPVFMASGSGCRIADIDGNEYIDFVMSWGPLILGHAHPAVVDAVRRAAERGTSFGTPTEAESELAELVVAMVPSAEKVRFCSSGTEATTFALRLARGYSGREKIVKFAGCYHGGTDALLVSAGSSALTIGKPDSAGVTRGTVADTIVVPFNDLDAVRAAFEAHPGEIAALIVEPYAGNMGLVLPRPGFLAGLREVTRASGALLIFDEVMTGFRVAAGGVQEREGILPDVTTLGKIIGGGLPVGAVAGPAEIMDRFTPEGDVFQAGTLSGNPLAMAAGIATLRALGEPGVYPRLDAAGARFTEGLDDLFTRHEVPHQTNHRGSMAGFFFASEPVVDLTSAKKSDTAFYAQFFHAMLDRGVYLAPSQFEAGFLSLAHDDAAIDATIDAAEDALADLFATA
jgi:glutamate-1-semialdehyde 2,1-aminomutase